MDAKKKPAGERAERTCVELAGRDDLRHTPNAPGLQAALVVAEWPKSVRENLRITLDQYQGRPVIDIRTWWWNEAGELRPGRAGLTVSTRHLRQLAAALVEAAEEAERSGFIDSRIER